MLTRKRLHDSALFTHTFNRVSRRNGNECAAVYDCGLNTSIKNLPIQKGARGIMNSHDLTSRIERCEPKSHGVLPLCTSVHNSQRHAALTMQTQYVATQRLALGSNNKGYF